MSLTMMLFVFFTWFFLSSFLFRILLKVKKHNCGTTVALLIIASAGTIWTQEAINWYQKWHQEWEITQEKQAAEEHARENQQKLRSFLQDMNPQLHKKVLEINNEITRIDHNIQQLLDLKQDFQNHTLVDQTLEQWQALKQQLSQVSQDIYQQVEDAYIAYRIDEIQGRKKFGELSEELLKEANKALENAEVTKTTIEEQLSE